MTNLEKHLAEHWLSGVQPDDWAYSCECGEKLADNDEDVDLDQVHRAHVAATWREARTVRTVEELDALDGGVVVMLLHSTGEPHGGRMNAAVDGGNLSTKRLDAETERDRLRATIARVRELHVCTHPIRDTIDDPYVYPCDECEERLPCSTIRALDGEAQG